MTADSYAKICVVMPAYNVADHVAASVESVRAQTWPEVELIVVDDGSTDETGDVLARLADEWDGAGRPMRVLSQPNRGAGAARNAGIAVAEAPFVALIDADDVCHPRLLAALMARLDGDSGIDIAFGLYRYVDAAGHVLGEQPAPPMARLSTYELLCDNIVHAPLIRVAALEAVGGLDESLTAHIDLDLFARIAQQRGSAIGVVPEILSDYRRRPCQITADWRRMRANWRRVAEKLDARGLSLTRRRRRRMQARLHLYWATLAYQAGNYAAARRLVAHAWSWDAATVARDPHGRVRSLACLASLLPGRLHDELRRRFNARRTR